MAGRSTGVDHAYQREMEVLQKLKALLQEKDTIAPEEYTQSLEAVKEEYERLLMDTKVLTSVGDRLQRKLKGANMLLQEQSDEIKRANDQISQKNADLQLAIDELAKARVSRKAQGYILGIAIILFIISELIEQFFDDLFGDDTNGYLIAWALKIMLVLFIKPIEGLVERQLLKSSTSKENRAVIDRVLSENEEKNMANAIGGIDAGGQQNNGEGAKPERPKPRRPRPVEAEG
jgi:hypothetical protein